MRLKALPFAKMHGCANDYVVVDACDLDADDWGALARWACDRRGGVGADGLLLAQRAPGADLRMRMFNPDGSESQMCGNGLRCLVRFAHEQGLLPDGATHRVATAAGLRPVTVHGREPWDVEIDMGRPQRDAAGEIELHVDGATLRLVRVGLGNPHAVHFTADVEAFDLARIGPQVERHPLFPERTNFEIVECLGPQRLCQRTWERGAGETPACGTGACAVLVAAVSTGRAARQVTVHLRGGELQVRLDERDHVFLRGPAVRVFEGTLGLSATGCEVRRTQGARRG